MGRLYTKHVYLTSRGVSGRSSWEIEISVVQGKDAVHMYMQAINVQKASVKDGTKGTAEVNHTRVA